MEIDLYFTEYLVYNFELPSVTLYQWEYGGQQIVSE